MKKVFLAMLAAMSVFITYAQDGGNKPAATVERGKPYPVINANKRFHGVSGEFLYSVKIRSKDIVLQSIDTSKLSQKHVNIITEYAGKDVDFMKTVKLGNKLYLVYTVWDKKLKQEQLYFREIDPALAKFAGPAKLIVKVDGKLSGSMHGTMFSLRTVDKFKLVFTKDNFMVYYKRTPLNKKDELNNDRIGLHVFNSELNEVWKTEDTMKYTEDQLSIISYELSLDNKVYLLCQLYPALKRNEKRNLEDTVSVIKTLLYVYENGKKPSETELDMKGKHIMSSALVQKPDGQMAIAGYYRNFRSVKTQGIYFASLSASGLIEQVNFNEIPVEIITRHIDKKSTEKKNKQDNEGKASIPNLYLDHVRLLEDGSILLIGEEFLHYTTRTVNSNGKVKTTYHYIYSSVYLSKIAADGSIAWHQKVGKNQRASTSANFFHDYVGGMSYRYSFDGNSHYIIYLDNVANLELGDNDSPKAHMDGMGGFLTAAVIGDAAGEMKKLSLFDMKSVKGMPVFQFLTDRVVLLSSSTLAVELYKKEKQDVMLKVKLK
jgi:hypothetical protein